MANRAPGPMGLTDLPVIDPNTLRRGESAAWGPIGTQCMAPHRDEVTAIATWMAGEMTVNAQGEDAAKMRTLNSFSADTCIADFTHLPLWRQLFGLGITPEQCLNLALSHNAAALLLWSLKVYEGGPWDHKGSIASRFHDRVAGGPQHWHLYGSTLYYYDVWSNLHYGYVGAAAGFSDAVLLDGAGLEQIGSTLRRLRKPEKAPDVSGLRAWDDASDRAAVTLGIDLFRRKPRHVSSADLLDLVLHGTAITQKPYRP